MPNITRGERMGGLLSYLVGPGRANEHTEPHLVAGDEPVMTWHDDAELERPTAMQIARYLDRPRAALGVDVPGGHVWHCSLSLRAAEGQLDDGRWADISRDFVERMGFTESSGKAACRWVAVRHGVSRAGNDHVHLVVSLVREDGTKASTWKDFSRAQKVAGELEREYGLEVLESRDLARGTRGVSPAEQARAERSGSVEPARVTLARQVRAVAGASVDEAAFVRGLRERGVWVRARYAAGREDVVVGYSVAAKPARGERAVWFGGGHLGRDLTITRLRHGWPDTPGASSAAVAQWQAARRGQPAGGSPRRGVRVDDGTLVACTREVEALRAHLSSIPVEDRAGWAHAARETSGALAAWSVRVEGRRPGGLARTSDALARYAVTRAHVQPRAVLRPSLRGTTLLLLTAADSGRGRAAEAVLVRQLARSLRAIHDAQQASGQARSAAHVAATVTADLMPLVHARPMPTTRPAVDQDAAQGSADAGGAASARDAVRVAARGQVGQGRPVGSPLPTDVTPRRWTSVTGPEWRGRGSDRGR